MAKTIRLLDTTLILLPERALWLPEYATLVVADWHLGKASHFRKAGIFMPLPTVDTDTVRLQGLITDHRIETLVLLGDLFHSEHNSEWLAFERFRASNPGVRFILTRGNHDILAEQHFHQAGVEVLPAYTLGRHILCTHAPEEELREGALNVAGHIHPGCLIPARGRQSYRLPCFYHHRQTLLLPAFGRLTGMHIMKPVRGASCYPVAGEEVLELAF